MNSIMPTNMITDDEMNQFLERHSIPKLTQEETYNLNRPTSSKENVWSIKGPDVFSGEFYRTFKKEIIPIPTMSSRK